MSNIDFLKGYPYTSKHALNADWLVERTQAVENAVDGVVAEAREIVADTEAAVTVMKTEFQGEVTTAKNDIAEDAGIAQAEISQSVNAGKASVQQQADAYTASSTFQNMVQQTANTQIAAYVNGQGLAAIQAAIDARIAGTAMQAIIANESPASRENAKQVNFLNGWQQGYTVNASGALAADALYIASNYIAVTPGEVVRLCHMDPPLQWNGMQDHYFYNGTTFVTKISAASTEPDRPVTVPAGVTQMRICMTLARYNISPYWMLCKNYKPARYVAPETATLVYTMTNKDMNRTRQYCGTVKYLTSPFQDIVITLGDFEITIRHDIDVSLFKDVWRIMQGKRISNGKNLWFGVDLDGVVKIQGESDFIGGYHGREQALETVILIDGKVLDIATAFSEKQFDSISILSTSSVYHRPDSAAGAEVFGRKKRIVINRKGITISNRLMALDSLTLETVYMGMLSCYKTLDNIKQLDGFMFEDDLQQRPYTELPLPPHDTKIGYMTIPESVMKLEILQDNFNGNMHMVDYTDRIKLYNGNTALVNMNPGEMIKCDSRLSFGYDMI